MEDKQLQFQVFKAQMRTDLDRGALLGERVRYTTTNTLQRVAWGSSRISWLWTISTMDRIMWVWLVGILAIPETCWYDGMNHKYHDLLSSGNVNPGDGINAKKGYSK
jgi:hypothetical protein